MMSELSQQMQQQLNAHKEKDKEARTKELKQMEDYKKKVLHFTWN